MEPFADQALPQHRRRAPRALVAGSLATAFAAALLACGDGGSGLSPQLQGTAATGAPMAGATITVLCAAGPTLATTAATNGTWSVPLQGVTLPCLVRASGGTPPITLHSIAQSSGAVNVTPITDLIVAGAARSDPAAWLAAHSGNLPGALAGLVADLPSAQQALARNLAEAGFDVPAKDLLTTPFNPAAGDPYDDLLEAVMQGAADNGYGYADLVHRVVTAGTGPVDLPKTDVVTQAQAAAMPQLNAASVTVADGVAVLKTSAGAGAVGAYVGGGNGNKAILQLPGFAGMKLHDFRQMTLDLRSLGALPTQTDTSLPYVAVNLMVDLNCDTTPLAAGATVQDARNRRRILTFDPYYTFLQPPVQIGAEFRSMTFTPESGGWRISAGAAVDQDTGVEESVHGSQSTLAGFDFARYPNACIVDGISADAGMFRNRAADPACNTASALAGSAPAVCGLAHSGAWLILGHSAMLKAGHWEVRKVRVNDRTITFR
ncbi:MAG TPA: hypothetical protein VFE82_15225 [Ramlibacter sp.]|jgi:hypothetical protein|uniref:hypothetical protein n=1 Tax=Ramlibacter sp. TaxID=1917967 RepID=UPI002D571048|nr:hypothetical protein [Ramlibacter sp.]HZY19824.1 hypothetical protein [Ramlibacter sp.]